jgi:predicted dehydrogenase
VTVKFGVVGIDHRHVYHLIGGLIDAGAECVGFDPQTSDLRVLQGLRERFPDLEALDRRVLLDDERIEVICSAAIPSARAAIAIEAMRNGKDVIVDKPGITSFSQLGAVQQAVQDTGRIFSICFSERFVVPANELAGRLIADGAVGEVIQTVGLGPHRLNRAIRPDWFFDRNCYGGILTDIASHQIDQFLFFTASTDARVVASSVGSFGSTAPGFQDFGEILLRSEKASGYVRVDWFTPDGLPTWGDGRLFILGTEGSLELRKYVDLAGRPGTDHVFLVDRTGARYIDASNTPLSYFRNFIADVRDRTETAMTQQHVFTVCRLALEAQACAALVANPQPAPL